MPPVFRKLFFLPAVLAAELLSLGGKTLDVEVARTNETRAKGLMGRTELNDGRGMLFVYEKSQILVFWMKDTLIPLSIGFFDRDRKLIQTLQMQPPKKGETALPTYRSDRPALYALEVPLGWFERNGIALGSRFDLPMEEKNFPGSK